VNEDRNRLISAVCVFEREKVTNCNFPAASNQAGRHLVIRKKTDV